MGYGSVVYLRCVDKNNEVSVHFLSAKSRDAPLKRISIPHLELRGALLLPNLMDYILTHIQPEVKVENLLRGQIRLLSSLGRIHFLIIGVPLYLIVFRLYMKKSLPLIYKNPLQPCRSKSVAKRSHAT